MNNIINLHTARQARLRDLARGITLCRSGFHRWQPAAGHPFKVREGKLLSVECCTRCGQSRTRLL